MIERSDENRVVITGMGIISPLGNTVSQFWDSLVAGKSGITVSCTKWATPHDGIGTIL